MSSLTLKNVPPSLMRKVHAVAAQGRRSLTQQIIVLLEAAIDENAVDIREDKDAQVRAWRELAGVWVSDETAQEETRALRKARTRGRPVGL